MSATPNCVPRGTVCDENVLPPTPPRVDAHVDVLVVAAAGAPAAAVAYGDAYAVAPPGRVYRPAPAPED